MIRYGFELEGFATLANVPVIPPKEWPVDGFPGLVEIRTTGGKGLHSAYAQILEGIIGLRQNSYSVDFRTCEWKFSGKEIAEMRRTRDFRKDYLDVKNIYGKEPRNLNGKTLASFQINISNVFSDEHTRIVGSERVTYPTRYRQLDVYRIVKRLDQEFSSEIRQSKRQPGMYALKDECRLEYRSLPNFIAELDMRFIPLFLERIKSAVER